MIEPKKRLTLLQRCYKEPWVPVGVHKPHRYLERKQLDALLERCPAARTLMDESLSGTMEADGSPAAITAVPFAASQSSSSRKASAKLTKRTPKSPKAF